MTVEMISHLLEALMILCFGLSWPLSIYKSWTSRTAKGKSLYFEVFIWIGYIFGIANKFISYMNNPDKDWIFFLAWAFYFLNIAEITVDMVLYFRNVKLDKNRTYQPIPKLKAMEDLFNKDANKASKYFISTYLVNK